MEAVDSKEGSSPLWDLKRDLVLLREELQEKNVTIRSLKNELLATTGRIQPNSPQSTTSTASCHNVATQTDRVCYPFSAISSFSSFSSFSSSSSLSSSSLFSSSASPYSSSVKSHVLYKSQTNNWRKWWMLGASWSGRIIAGCLIDWS